MRPVRAHQHTHTHTRNNRWTSTRFLLDITTLWCFLKRNKGIQSTCTTSTQLLSPTMQCRFTARVRRSMDPTNTEAHTNSPYYLFARARLPCLDFLNHSLFSSRIYRVKTTRWLAYVHAQTKHCVDTYRLHPAQMRESDAGARSGVVPQILTAKKLRYEKRFAQKRVRNSLGITRGILRKTLLNKYNIRRR